MTIESTTVSMLILLFVISFPASAESRIAVLDFELNDLTSNPRTGEEVERTASLKSLLEERLTVSGYSIAPLSQAAQVTANQGFGYLWDHPEEAAALGRLYGSRYIVVGRVNKPSFLFAHLLTRVVNVVTEEVVGEFDVEVKGQQGRFTGKGVDNLARQIDGVLRKISETHVGT